MLVTSGCPFNSQSLFDETESISLSPEINRKKLQNNVREYELDGMSVKRYVINDLSKQLIGASLGTADLHKIEVELFESAYNELKNRPSANDPITGSPNNIVLVDTFVREDNCIKNDNGKPAIHTICLWKKTHNTFLLIDPTNSTFTENLKAPIEKLLNVTIEINKPRGQKFYSSPLACPLIGTSPETFRDCIDIAIKIAFHLNNSQAKGISPSINVLSNQTAINGDVIGKANAIRLRELQSTNETKRVHAQKLLKNNEKYLECLEVQTLEDLEELESSLKNSLDQSLERHAITLKITKKISFTKLQQLDELQDKIDVLNRNIEEINGFSNLKITLGEEKEITRYIDNEENYTQLHLAVQQGKNDEVEEFLKNHKNNLKLIGASDKYGQTALHWAAGQGNIGTAKLLVKFMDSKDITKQTNINKFTALHLAAHSSSTEIIKFIVNRGIASLCGMQDINGQTALYWAAANGKTEIALMLIDAMDESEIIKISEGEKNTALHVAVHSGNNALVKAFTDQKRFPHLYGIQDKHGQTALYWAVATEKTEAALMLMNAMDESEIIKISEGEKNTALHVAVHSGNNDLVKAFTDKKRFPHLYGIQDTNGRTALHWAAGNGNIEAARLLIEAMTEEDIKKQRSEGQTALVRAIHANSLPIVKLLLKKVPSLASINDVYGQSPLFWASGKKEIYEYLS